MKWIQTEVNSNFCKSEAKQIKSVYRITNKNNACPAACNYRAVVFLITPSHLLPRTRANEEINLHKDCVVLSDFISHAAMRFKMLRCSKFELERKNTLCVNKGVCPIQVLVDGWSYSFREVPRNAVGFNFVFVLFFSFLVFLPDILLFYTA